MGGGVKDGQAIGVTRGPAHRGDAAHKWPRTEPGALAKGSDRIPTIPAAANEAPPI